MKKTGKIKYFNAKTGKYQTGQVLEVKGDIVYCFNKQANFRYQESLQNLKRLESANNPNWHGQTKKPLVIL
ncbi:hypothetical protein V6O07_14865, partial [Arthrospira platensis SPKY2]